MGGHGDLSCLSQEWVRSYSFGKRTMWEAPMDHV